MRGGGGAEPIPTKELRVFQCSFYEVIYLALFLRQNDLSSPAKVDLSAESLLSSGYRPDRPSILLRKQDKSHMLSLYKPLIFNRDLILLW